MRAIAVTLAACGAAAPAVSPAPEGRTATEAARPPSDRFGVMAVPVVRIHRSASGVGARPAP